MPLPLVGGRGLRCRRQGADSAPADSGCWTHRHRVAARAATPTTIGEISYVAFRAWQDDASGLQNLAAIGSVNWSLVLREGEPATIPVAAVSASFFPLLAATPFLCRAILPEDDQRGAGKIAVLSHGSWVAASGGSRHREPATEIRRRHLHGRRRDA